MKREIDHIVYSVTDLDAAIENLEQTLGARPIIGGFHKTKGTKNALLNLGNKIYLEILAIDELNTSIEPPRWMGIDLIQQSQITRWCLNSNDLSKDSQIVADYNVKMGVIDSGERYTPSGSKLAWEMILPLAEPAVDIIPFMCNWSSSETHPTESLESECELLEIIVTHPKPQNLQKVLDQLGVTLNIRIGEKQKINIVIKCPNGIVTI